MTCRVLLSKKYRSCKGQQFAAELVVSNAWCKHDTCFAAIWNPLESNSQTLFHFEVLGSMISVRLELRWVTSLALINTVDLTSAMYLPRIKDQLNASGILSKVGATTAMSGNKGCEDQQLFTILSVHNAGQWVQHRRSRLTVVRVACMHVVPKLLYYGISPLVPAPVESRMQTSPPGSYCLILNWCWSVYYKCLRTINYFLCDLSTSLTTYLCAEGRLYFRNTYRLS